MTAVAASAITLRRGASGQSERAMPHTACATTATAATFRPCSRPSGTWLPVADSPSASTISAMAEGMVKPSHAASAPR
ncbi:hypothetical protein LMG19282_05471 [Cupriavidus campinensis]|nr:hypothetical protein LMG19282_05471 [Cupriavidus campinensis]